MTSCRWCAAEMAPSRQSARRFCSNACRLQFHDACRRLGERMFETGAVSIEVLRSSLNTVPEAVNGPVGVI